MTILAPTPQTRPRRKIKFQKERRGYKFSPVIFVCVTKATFECNKHPLQIVGAVPHAQLQGGI
jgi:hypothetical protein